MTNIPLKQRIEKKELQFNALLEITQAINSNVSENALYKIFKFTLRSNLNINKLALFISDGGWNCKINFGTQINFGNVELEDRFKNITEIHRLSQYQDSLFCEFDTMIPIIHEHHTLALVFVGHTGNGILVDEHIKFIQLLSNITMTAVENKRLARKELKQQAFRKELEIAGDVQHFLFPKNLPHTNRLKIAASYLPHDLIGGDYYDYIPIDENKFLICVADVSGKGIPAALLMSHFHASLRALIRQTLDLRKIIETLNYRVLEIMEGEKFITFFGAIYDLSLNTMTYVNAGHNPPFLHTDKLGMTLLEKGSTVLGAMHPLPFLNEGVITHLDQFFLFAYTDGLTETINEKGEQFSQSALMDYLSTHYTKELRMIHQDVIIELDNFKGKKGYQDDITILSCCVRNT